MIASGYWVSRTCHVVSDTHMMLQGTARQIHSIATHPSQPDKCASGGSNGTVAVWDLRFAAAPVVANTGKQNAGDVWQVCCHSLLVSDSIADATAIVQLATSSVHYLPGTSYECPTPQRILQCVESTPRQLSLQVHFDADYESGAAQTPPVLFCTDDGNLCRVDWAGHGAAALNQMQDNEQQRDNSSDGHVSVLLTEASSVNGFDVDGTDIVAVVEQECMCYIKRRSQTF